MREENKIDNFREKCGEIAMRYYEMLSFYNRLWEAKVGKHQCISGSRMRDYFIWCGAVNCSSSGYASIIHSSFLLDCTGCHSSTFGNVSEALLKKSQAGPQLATLAKKKRTEKNVQLISVANKKSGIVYESSGFSLFRNGNFFQKTA